MGEKIEIVCRYVGQGLRLADAVAIAGIKKSTLPKTDNKINRLVTFFAICSSPKTDL
jgi:hypothetical protein